jgi:hypothetical protein
MLHGGGIIRSVRQAINYHLESYEFEYIAVTSATRTAATPHEHIYLWIDDSAGDVTPEMLTPALERHTDRCANAYENDHPIRADGKGGAITVYQDPPLIKHKPEKLAEILEGDTPNRPNTRGAHYLATQLSHLPAANLCNSNEPEPTNAELDGGVVAWLSPHQWFKCSRGFST